MRDSPSAIARPFEYDGNVDRVPRRLDPQAQNEDLLTTRPTLATPRLCHNAKAELLRKQQVLGSNPSVGSTPPFRAQEALLCGLRDRHRGVEWCATTLQRPGRPANCTNWGDLCRGPSFKQGRVDRLSDPD